MIPFFTLFDLKIYSYPFIMGAAWGVGYHISRILNLNYKKLDSFNLAFILIFISSWLGAKLFFVFTTDLEGSERLLQNTNFWFGGGFVFYGGLVGGLVTLVIYKYYRKINLSSFNIFIPSLIIGHGLGRVGCALAGCCYGKVLEHKHFYSVFMHGQERYPVQIIEASILLCFGLYSLRNFKKLQAKLIPIYLMFYSILRFCTEFIRGDKIRGVWFDLISTSQIISVMLVLILIINVALQKSYVKSKS